MTYKILVGVDGSEHATRAVAWCAAHAAGFDAEVVAVHAVDLPVYLGSVITAFPAPFLTPQQRDELRDVVSRDWCKPLADAGVTYRVLLMDGRPASALLAAAESEPADMVVTGRRGRGGFAELVLGSTSHDLAHHLTCPLVIVP